MFPVRTSFHQGYQSSRLPDGVLPLRSRVAQVKRSPIERKTPLATSAEKVRDFHHRGAANSSRKRRAVSPASKAQREAIHGRPCIVTAETDVVPAHLIDRSLGGCDSELCTVPLSFDAHRAYDEHELDLLPYLEAHGLREELAHAVTHLGLLGALQRITNTTWAPAGVPIILGGSL